MRGLLIRLFSFRLNSAQASYVESLFMAGADPEEIGRAVNKVYGRLLKKGESDHYTDGLEYLRAAMIKQGAIIPRRDGDYYQTAHPMTQRLAGIAAVAPIPEKGVLNGQT